MALFRYVQTSFTLSDSIGLLLSEIPCQANIQEIQDENYV